MCVRVRRMNHEFLACELKNRTKDSETTNDLRRQLLHEKEARIRLEIELLREMEYTDSLLAVQEVIRTEVLIHPRSETSGWEIMQALVKAHSVDEFRYMAHEIMLARKRIIQRANICRSPIRRMQTPDALHNQLVKIQRELDLVKRASREFKPPTR